MDSPEMEYLKTMAVTQNIQMDGLKAMLTMLYSIEVAKMAREIGLPVERVSAEMDQLRKNVLQDTVEQQLEFRRQIYDMLSRRQSAHP